MRLSENGYFPQPLRQAQTLILKILQCILAVKIFAFLDFVKDFSFSDELLSVFPQSPSSLIPAAEAVLDISPGPRHLS